MVILRDCWQSSEIVNIAALLLPIFAIICNTDNIGDIKIHMGCWQYSGIVKFANICNIDNISHNYNSQELLMLPILLILTIIAILTVTDNTDNSQDLLTILSDC